LGDVRSSVRFEGWGALDKLWTLGSSTVIIAKLGGGVTCKKSGPLGRSDVRRPHGKTGLLLQYPAGPS
jgi:hypothetical protein